VLTWIKGCGGVEVEVISRLTGGKLVPDLTTTTREFDPIKHIETEGRSKNEVVAVYEWKLELEMKIRDAGL
jgi:hypothetical protein